MTVNWCLGALLGTQTRFFKRNPEMIISYQYPLFDHNNEKATPGNCSLLDLWFFSMIYVNWEKFGANSLTNAQDTYLLSTVKTSLRCIKMYYIQNNGNVLLWHVMLSQLNNVIVNHGQLSRSVMHVSFTHSPTELFPYSVGSAVVTPIERSSTFLILALISLSFCSMELAWSL